MEWLKLIASILSGLTVAIPLVIQLVKYVQKVVHEKTVFEFIVKYMACAEDKFQTGVDRKEWVLAMVQTSADAIGYEIDIDAISGLIDSLCAMTKIVNASKKKEGA